VEIEEALERAHTWLRSQSWWSDDRDAIVSISRTDRSWRVGHTSRRWLETGNDLDVPIGGFGPLVITDEGHITQMGSEFGERLKKYQSIEEAVESTMQQLERLASEDKEHPLIVGSVGRSETQAPDQRERVSHFAGLG
jgi:hypothetical protein